MTKFYGYAKCSTCRNAMKFLEKRQIEVKSIDIVDSPPSQAEIKKMLGHVGDIKKLFNTSGQAYRQMKLSQKIPTMSHAEAIKLLASHGKLIKRPFVLSPSSGTVGFKEADWKRLFK